MNRKIQIAPDSLWHFVYNCACILVGALGIGISREYRDHALVSFIGLGIAVIAFMAWRWQNPGK